MLEMLLGRTILYLIWTKIVVKLVTETWKNAEENPADRTVAKVWLVLMVITWIVQAIFLFLLVIWAFRCAF